MAGNTVVYLIKDPDSTGFYYEFKYDKVNKTSTVMRYPEGHKGVDIVSLLEKSTYYIVDPGGTKSNCNRGKDFVAKVIIVASPKDNNWGKSNFSKGGGAEESTKGFFK